VVALLARTVRSGTPLAMTNAPNIRHGKRKQRKSKKRKGFTMKIGLTLMNKKNGGNHGEERLFSQAGRAETGILRCW
jgi:hypothetical protein